MLPAHPSLLGRKHVSPMKTPKMEFPKVVNRTDWLSARLQLLAKEKELTQRRDALNAERRRLPMVKIEKDYRVEGPKGNASLLDLFEDRLQLVIYHFMWLWKNDQPLDLDAGAVRVGPIKSPLGT